MKILIINSGSSSLKYELIDIEKEETIVNGICERIGIADPILTYKNLRDGKEIKKQPTDLPDHKTAINVVLAKLKDPEVGVIVSAEEIDGIGHRVVHGGEYFDDSVIVDDAVLEKLEELVELAPLHNPANIMGIRVMQELLPNKKNVAVFDTAFHQTMDPIAYMYALPYEDYTELKVRKYGFHGTSHKYVSQVAAEMLGKKESKVIVCHLGNGASLSAVVNGKSVDTSMGLTPLQGMMMGTRCGDIDPAAVLYIMNKRNLSSQEMDDRMNKKSGFLGVTGVSSDCRDVEDAEAAGNERAALSLRMYEHRLKGYVGNYAAIMNGVDAIAFTGGIGENSPETREAVCDGLEFMGVKINKEKNKVRVSGHVDLSAPDSRVKVYKIQTAEELMIARDTYRLLK